ncbi:MAG TPA: hypothetical protein VMI54_10330 [Polyangiaceae bacterium]|nr:hypothetical protein [Polyangiaceae bacterium]
MSTRGPLSIPWFERITLAICGVTLVVVLAAWGFMRANAFSLAHVFGVAGPVAVGAVAFLWFTRARAGGVPDPKRAWRVAGVAAALTLGFGLLYAWFPTYFLLGGQDPGPYLEFAARIAKTGGMNLTVPSIEAWASQHTPGYMRSFPALYGQLAHPEAPPGLQAQFVHLFTAYDAVFFALHGVEGAVRANAWLACLCLALGFSLLRRIATERAAFAFLVVLAINPAFVWASRITLTETLGLWLNLGGLLVLALAWDFASPKLGFLAGALFGVGILNRLDGGLGSFAVLGFGIAALLGKPEHRSVAAAAAFAHLVTSLACYRDSYLFSAVYYRSLVQVSDTLRILPWLTSGTDLFVLVLALMPAKLIGTLRLNETWLRMAGYAAVWAGVGWVAYGLTVRPFLDHSEDSHTVGQLTWYFGWACWFLAFGGLALALRAASFTRWLPLVAFLLPTLVIYTVRTDAAPVHIWASRRWVPHVLPLILAAAALGADWVLARPWRGRAVFAAPALLALFWLGPPLDFVRAFLFRSMLKGLPEAYEHVAEFAREHSDRWPAVTDHVSLGSILTYVYDVPTVLLTEDGTAALDRSEFEGGLSVGLNAFDRHDGRGALGGYVFPYLSATKDEPPTDVGDARHALEIGFLGPKAFSVDMPASHPAFRWQVSHIAPDGSVVTNGQRGRPLYGPFVGLQPGHFRVAWYGWLDYAPPDKSQGVLDVISRIPKRDIAETELEVEPTDGHETQLGAIDFKLDEPVQYAEFRVRVERGVKLVITRVHLERFDERLRASTP